MLLCNHCAVLWLCSVLGFSDSLVLSILGCSLSHHLTPTLPMDSLHQMIGIGMHARTRRCSVLYPNQRLKTNLQSVPSFDWNSFKSIGSINPQIVVLEVDPFAKSIPLRPRSRVDCQVHSTIRMQFWQTNVHTVLHQMNFLLNRYTSQPQLLTQANTLHLVLVASSSPQSPQQSL